MEKSVARKLIQDTFQVSFSKERFVSLVKNIFNHIDETKNFIYRGNYIPNAYEPFIRSLERIGKFVDTEDNKTDILIVHLKRDSSLEHARTRQRNFIAWYLNGSRGGELKDAALVAFYTDNSADWRFSLIKMDYSLESNAGKTKVTTELTPARRYSFLVGANENSHTAQSRLVKILEDDVHDPTLRELEEVFNIETVTKEFFEKYRFLFESLKDSLDQIIEENGKIRHDFLSKGVETVNFAKKLLGQIVFLYFLQKKGWFGVERDQDWGTGTFLMRF
jgi:hypothetical protein